MIKYLYTMLQLEKFAQNVAKKFNSELDFEHRFKAAETIAKKYKFDNPHLVLFITHPELSSLSFKSRCSYLSATEEELALLMAQKGFQAFLRDYKTHFRDVIEMQSLGNLSRTLETPRFTVDEDGNEHPDLTLEKAIVQSTAPNTQQPTQVNVQVNNLWSEARARLVTPS